MASNKFDTGFAPIKVKGLTLNYTTQYGKTKVEGNITEVIKHLIDLIK